MIRKLTKDEFIEKSKLIHGDKYDYSKSDYKHTHHKIEIICKIHGGFLQMPYSHLFGKGCSRCSKKYKPNTNEFIEKSNLIHNNKYGYSKVNYINNHSKICIVCPKHGEFFQTPNNHLCGKGCRKCKLENQSILQLSNTNEFILKSLKIHNKKYDYLKVDYKGNKKKIIIICKKHKEFLQTPNRHLMGDGCPKCSKYISKSEIEFLDYLKIKERHFSLPKWKNKFVDGIDLKTNTIYEFLGDYYHGNPLKYNPNDYNKTCHKTFGKLYKNTIKIFNKLKLLGYNIKYVWENDWKRFKNDIDKTLNIISYA